MRYLLIFFLLVLLELGYFRLADRFHIVDRPNARSSHSKVVIRGGGVIFLFALWLWSVFFGFPYPWLLAGVTLAAGVSFVDDVHPLPDSARLLVQFVAMGLLFRELDLLHPALWWAVLLALIVCVGATNIYNFMDGINGITAAYSLAVLLPLSLLNGRHAFASGSLMTVMLLAVLVFGFFNFRPKNKAKCFAGDVGSVGIAFILLFLIGALVLKTGDITWLLFLVVYGADGCCTILHRMQLHERLGEAHRKHAYQLMANELGLSHVTVSLIYAGLQLLISLGMIYLVPDTLPAHGLYLLAVVLLLTGGYALFMKKYYHLHADYLASLKK